MVHEQIGMSPGKGRRGGDLSKMTRTVTGLQGCSQVAPKQLGELMASFQGIQAKAIGSAFLANVKLPVPGATWSAESPLALLFSPNTRCKESYAFWLLVHLFAQAPEN